MRRFLSFCVIYAIVMFTLHIWLDAPRWSMNVEASNRLFYISSSLGSNSNAGTLLSPWKTHPFMKTGSACTGSGSGPSYTPQAGDQFVLRGGDTWPAACFGMTLSSGGTATAQNYIGVCINNTDFATQYPNRSLTFNYSPCANGTSYPSSGWVRPIFDMAGNVVGTAGGNQVMYATLSTGARYTTIDDIEIVHQGIGNLTSGATTNNQAAISLGCANSSQCATYDPGTIVANMYIHGAETSIGTNTKPDGVHWASLQYGAGGIDGAQLDVYNEINGDDALNGGVTPNSTNLLWFMGTGQHNQVMAYDKFHGTINGCDQLPVGSSGWSCHDNELYHVSNAGQDSAGIHSHVVFDEQTQSDNPSATTYNNAIHDTNAGLTIAVNARALVFNNVLWNNLSGNAGIRIQRCGINAQTCPASDQDYFFNNTIYGTSSGCIVSEVVSGTAVGSITIQNNICINSSISIAAGSYTGTLTQSNNRAPMSLSEASQYGFVASSRFSPSSADPFTAGQGINLTNNAGFIAALGFDASGAPWFGGSYKPRPAPPGLPDLGAYQGQTGSPPAVAFTSPTCGTNCGGSQTLTVTATPAGSATITSCQFFIDSYPFGTAVTSSPYTKSWVTTTAANAQHVLNAKCTDSLGQTGSASPTVTVTVNNSIPGCFISTDNGSTPTPLSWTGNQSIGTQTSNFSLTVTITPNSANQNSVHALSENPMAAYTDGAALLRANSSGLWDAWDDSFGDYHAVNSASYTPGTAYTFVFTPNFTGPNAGSYSISETLPSSIVIATNYTFRSTALIASLGFFNSSAINDTPDTAKVCNVVVSPTTTLTFSPSSLNFGNVASGGNLSLSVTVTSAGGSTAFTSVTAAGTGFSKTTDTCSTNTVSSCSFTIQFAPSSVGGFSGTVTLVDGAAGSPQVINLNGTGIATAASVTPVPTSVNFGNVQIGTNSTSGQVILSLANGPITFDATPVTFDNPEFSVASISCTGSQSGSTCQITPQVTPLVLGNRTATMTIHDNAPTPGSTQTVSLLANSVNFPVPAPASQFVFQDNFPVTFTIRGKTYTYIYVGTCNCQWVNQKWGCICQ